MPATFYGETNQAQRTGDFVLICIMKGKAWWKDSLPELELKWLFVFVAVVRYPVGQHLQRGSDSWSFKCRLIPSEPPSPDVLTFKIHLSLLIWFQIDLSSQCCLVSRCISLENSGHSFESITGNEWSLQMTFLLLSGAQNIGCYFGISRFFQNYLDASNTS